MYYRSTARWLKEFRDNSRRIYPIKVDTHNLTPEERSVITCSIQDFQLGESSEGKTLLKYAKEFSQKYGIREYAPLMSYFIAEENRHSVYLGRFMKQHKITRKRQTFNDSIFRFLRKLVGIETSIRTLVTAEIIALLYYQCLAMSTGSSVLKGICHHMLSEEETHVHFQMQHIQFINLQKVYPFSRVADFLHRILLWGTLVTVWFHHKKVLKAKFTPLSFFREGNQQFTRILRNGRHLGVAMISDWRGRGGFAHVA